MKRVNNRLTGLLLLVASLLVTPVLCSTTFAAETEETFDVLQTKTGTYTNVTVTAKNKDWILILHSAGMVNIRITDLSEEAQLALGYAEPKDSNSKDMSAVIDSLSKMEMPPMAELEESWKTDGPRQMVNLALQSTFVWVVLGIFAAIYLFYCFCSMKICQKAGTEPGLLVWIPVLQIIPLLRAARMPLLWFFAYFIPVLNIIAQIVWYVKIVDARGKSPIVIFLLLLPITCPFAYMYLAFSDGETTAEKEKVVPLVLETA